MSSLIVFMAFLLFASMARIIFDRAIMRSQRELIAAQRRKIAALDAYIVELERAKELRNG